MICGLSGVVGIGLLIHKFIYRGLIEGWVSVMISVWFLGGMLIFCVGIIGIYVSKIFIETKNRPYTIVRKVYNPDETAAKNPLKNTTSRRGH
jgi:putative glycosyltransferase